VKLPIAIALVTALVTTSAFAADMAVKAPPPAPAPVPTWTGYYGGIQFGGGWSDEAVNFSPNDPVAAEILSGTIGFPGEQPVANPRISQSGPVGGFEAGYNWQAGPNWVLGLETDFSGSGMSGHASSTSTLIGAPQFFTQTTTAEQRNDWYGTVRGRAGWLATPNLLLFGTGGFAYGRVGDSADYAQSGLGSFISTGPGGVSVYCVNFAGAGATCMVGSSSAIRTGWTVGGGVEGLLDQHWSAKIEYQFVDLGTETAPITAVAVCTIATCGFSAPTPASFNAAFHDRFNVVRVGLNYRFW
jgi:outer membrane immunogenic protein